MAKRRHLTPTQVKRQQHGGEYLGPGVWVDRGGGLHFSAPEILQQLGIPNTEASREWIVGVIREQLREQCPDATVIEQDDTRTDG